MKNSLENNERALNAVVCGEILFHSFITNPKRSYLECADNFLKTREIKISKSETKEFCYRILYFQQMSLLREILCLVQNGVKRGRVDLTNPKFVDEVKKLKEKTIVKGDKNITNYNYIKTIRNVLAHNNELTENPKIIYDTEEKENKKVVIKPDDTDIVLELSMQDMHKLCEAIFKGINKTDALGIYPKRLENALIGEYFDIEKLNRYINGFNDDATYDLTLDDFQKTAFVNYLKTGVLQEDKLIIPFEHRGEQCGIRLVYPDLIKQVFPSNSKPEDLAFHKCFIYFTNNIVAENLNRTKDDVLDYCKTKPELLNIFMNYCLNSNYSSFLSVTNGLYSILSDREIEDIEIEFVNKLGKENIRHIRNALEHGTYYYNFNNGVEIYDGGKKLKHITTINLSETAYSMHSLIIDRSKENLENA